MVADGLTWQEWRSGGEELLMLRDLAPSVSEAVLAAAYRQYDGSETPEARGDVLELLVAAQEAAVKEEGE